MHGGGGNGGAIVDSNDLQIKILPTQRSNVNSRANLNATSRPYPPPALRHNHASSSRHNDGSVANSENDDAIARIPLTTSYDSNDQSAIRISAL